MKILWISRTCPYPANDGEKIRVFNLLKNLSHHEITIVFRVMSESEIDGAEYLKQYCREVRWAHVPSPQSNLTRIKWCLPFLFSASPLGMATVYFRQIRQILKQLCAANSYDIVVIEHSSQSVYLDDMVFPNRPVKIVTMHNIDYIRNERVLENIRFGARKIFYYLNQKKFKVWELSALKRYDLVITVSETDRDILLQEDGSLNIFVAPNGVDTDYYATAYTAGKKNAHALLFVASMDSEANNDAALFFLDHIFPLVKAKCADASVYLVGRRPGKRLSSRHNDVDVFVTGEVADVLPYYDGAAVTVVPLRSGGGTRLKILEAMAAGLPVVTTSVGCEGLKVEDNRHLMIVDDPGKFADCIVRLFEDVELGKKLVANARDLVLEQYDWKLIAKKCDDMFHEITGRLQQTESAP